MADRHICVVCGNTKLTLHSLPYNEEQRKKWLEFVYGTPPKRYNCARFLCSDHFSHSDFLNLGEYSRGFASKLILKPGAVPTQRSTTTGSQSSPRSRPLDGCVNVDVSPAGRHQACANLEKATLAIMKVLKAKPECLVLPPVESTPTEAVDPSPAESTPAEAVDPSPAESTPAEAVDPSQVCRQLEKATVSILKILQTVRWLKNEQCENKILQQNLAEQVEANQQLQLKTNQLQEHLEDKQKLLAQAHKTVEVLKEEQGQINSIRQSLMEQVEANKQLKLKIDELQTQLEEKDNLLRQTISQTVDVLKEEEDYSVQQTCLRPMEASKRLKLEIDESQTHLKEEKEDTTQEGGTLAENLSVQVTQMEEFIKQQQRFDQLQKHLEEKDVLPAGKRQKHLEEKDVLPDK